MILHIIIITVILIVSIIISVYCKLKKDKDFWVFVALTLSLIVDLIALLVE